MLVAPAAGQVLYRLVGNREARLRDFQSWRDRDQESGHDARFPDDPWIDYVCISMYETEEIAVEGSNIFPAYIAPVRLKRNNGFSFARTQVDIHGHYSVWGDPEKLLLAVEGEPIPYTARP
jgi:hypothetical protein